MSGKAFLDTNIFVYANDRTDPRKQTIALGLVHDATVSRNAAVSYQVIHEFFNVVLKKSHLKMRPEEAQLFLDVVFRPLLTVPPSIALVSEAIRIQERYKLSWYDSLIVSAAQQGGCSVLYSEDLQDGQQFGGVTVRNPFL